MLIYIEEDDKIVATLGVKDVKEKEATIDVVAVDKNYRGRGYSSILLKEIEKKIASKRYRKCISWS